MKQEKGGLSSFKTFFIFGCAVSFVGVLLQENYTIWSGLILIVIGIIAGALKK